MVMIASHGYFDAAADWPDASGNYIYHCLFASDAVNDQLRDEDDLDDVLTTCGAQVDLLWLETCYSGGWIPEVGTLDGLSIGDRYVITSDFDVDPDDLENPSTPPNNEMPQGTACWDEFYADLDNNPRAGVHAVWVAMDNDGHLRDHLYTNAYNDGPHNGRLFLW